MNNPFAVAAQAPAPTANPFAAQSAAPMPASNPFAPQVSGGMAAIQAAFAQPAQPPPPAAANPFTPAPLNPPGEAGLGTVPVVAPAQVEAPTVVEPDPAPRAKRGRKPRAAQAESIQQDAPQDNSSDGMAYTPDPPVPAQDLSSYTTEALREELKSRGWAVTLTDA
jgi:hypothetical protein